MRGSETQAAPDIAVFSPLYSGGPRHGGITPVILNLTRAFSERGLSVDLLVRLPTTGPPAELDLPAGVQLIDLGRGGRLRNLYAVAAYLRRRCPRALLAAGHRYNLVASWAAMLNPASRVVLSVHSVTSGEAASKGAWSRWRRLRSIDLWYRQAARIIAVSEAVAEDLRRHTRLPAERLAVVYNPIVTPELFARAQDPVDNPWLEAGAPPVIVGVGRLSRLKGFDVLLRAFARLRRYRPCRLLILGEGPERAALEALAEELELGADFLLPGFTPNPYPYIAKAQLLVMSSRYEGFGNVLVKALALGTPVVASDCPGGPREILANGRHGHLVPPGDVCALAAAMEQALEEPPEPLDRRDAMERFGIEQAVAGYLAQLRPSL